MKKIIRTIISVEFIFAVFLLSGAFKEVFTWIPVDLTIATLLITFLIAMKRLYEKRTINIEATHILVIFIIFIFIMLLSILYTDSNSYFIDKTLRFVFITSWAFIAPFLILNTKQTLSKFITALAIIASIASIMVLYNYFNNSNVNTNFVGISGGNYLGTARLIGAGSVSLLIIYIYQENIQKSFRLITIVCLIFSVFALLLTGARMPVIAFGITFLSILLFGIIIKENKVYIKTGVKRIITIILFIFVGYFILKDSEFTQTFFSRIKILFNDAGMSGAGRFERFETAIDMIAENPLFGQGIGSYGINFSGRDSREYAHNILFEVSSEMGLIGLTLILLMIAIVLIRTIFNIKYGGYYNIWIFASLVYLITNAFVSGDLNDNRLLFAFLGIAAHSSAFIISEKNLDSADKIKASFSEGTH